ncbi:NACHT domain-containing protein [Streptomyces rubiginosohelvolus]|uniref:NACHT domain-containing protein n=1 Tax=Streptomyces rubiginosohelvolus TaxID=67362 RepID=UPI0037ABC95D
MNIDGVEHDGVYFTHDLVHCVEATVSRRKDKAEHDGKKLSREINKRTGSNGRVARGWFVTLSDPTPEQTKALRTIDRRIVPISFNRFKARLFDAHLYHQRRKCVPFGSAINPTDRKAALDPYIPADFHNGGYETEGAPSSFEDLVTRTSAGENFCIVGDYGMGKSMTLRELYLRLSGLYRDDKTLRHPVHLNLRDHWGQRSPRVALTQHAEDLGYDRPDQIISAWRAGYVDILLDGFDEIAAPGWSSDVVELRHSRRRAVELVRNFFEQTDSRASVVVVGRRSYFDSLPELRSSLFDSEACTLLEVAEFNEQQVAEYLAGKRWYTLPDWLPKRPLLIGYLAAQSLLDGEVQETEGMNPAGGWDWLLEQISRREAKIETGIDGETVRKIIERLASVARKGASSLGPLTYSEITEGFKFVRGREPSDDQRTILHRLPGLGSDPNFEEGTRKFIDIDLASAAQAKDISSFILNPFGIDLEAARSWSGSLEQSGVEVAALQCITTANQGSIENALQFAKRNDLDVLSADVARVALASNIEVVDSSCSVSGVVIPRIDLYEGCSNFSGAQFSHCLIETLCLDGEIDDGFLPVFESCHFESVVGRFGENDLPTSSFHGGCTFADFPDMAERNADVLRSSLPRGVRIMVTVLRKLYLQRGSGRAEGAFVRGMPQEDRSLVPECLDILRRDGLVSTIKLGGRIIWLPKRSEQKRVKEFVTAPRGSGDGLFAAAAKLS